MKNAVWIAAAFAVVFIAARRLPAAESRAKDAPVAQDASFVTPGRNLVVNVKGRGGEAPLTTEVVSQPAHGRAEVRSKGLGRIKYTPQKGYVGEDRFTFRVVDKNGVASAPATVTMTVTPRGEGDYSSGVSFKPPPHLATIGATDNRLFKIGILDVTLYNGWDGNPVDPSGVKDSTAALQKALDDGYDYQLAVFFPAGTYTVSDTLRVVRKRSRFATWHCTAVIGSRKNGRPVIRLAANARGFNDPANPKPVVWVWTNREGFNRAFGAPASEFSTNEQKEQSAAMGFLQSVEGLIIDCNGEKGNSGAIGLRFGAAQASSIHDVKVIATGAFAGIYDIPSRSSAGAANIEVEGGRYGLYLNSGASSIVVGATLRNQTEAALFSTQFPPIAVVGFHIVKETGPVLSVQDPAWSTATGTMSLLDGVVELRKGGIAFENPAGKNFYVRNVYVKGASALVKTPRRTLTGHGGWTRVGEYVDVDHRTFPDDPPYEFRDSKFAGFAVLNGKSGKEEPARIEPSPAGPPSDVVSRHVWDKLPSFEDPDCVVLTEVCAANGADEKDDWAAFQKAVDTHEKILVPKGMFRLGRTLTLGARTQLFGVSRATSRIFSHPDWKPTSEAAIVQTVDDARATTVLCNIHLGFQCGVKEHDWWNLLNWRAGRRSICFGVTERDGAEGAYERMQKSRETNPHSLFKVSGSGGGRWYFWGVDWNGPNQHPGYRHLLIDGTHEPLWLYGCNLEKGLGVTRCEIRNARNVRIFSVKIEGDRPIFKIHDSANVAVFSSGAMRGHCAGYKGYGESAYYWVSGRSEGILFANVNPQTNGRGQDSLTLLEERGGVRVEVRYPEMVAVYKRGELDDGAMW
ncbi:MAG: cadherin-like domain-containing protein [Kiritimatiellae bacterium]|nr:cadherin-like domain-containing protein [Kiritimatiellia bacterium]